MLTREYLKINKADIDGTSFTIATGTYTSDAIKPHYSTGKAALEIKTSAGALVVTYQVRSSSTATWYEPYSTQGTKVNTVATGLGGDRLIYFEPVVAEEMRFVFVLTSADSTVSAIYQQQEIKR